MSRSESPARAALRSAGGCSAERESQGVRTTPVLCVKKAGETEQCRGGEDFGMSQSVEKKRKRRRSRKEMEMERKAR